MCTHQDDEESDQYMLSVLRDEWCVLRVEESLDESIALYVDRSLYSFIWYGRGLSAAMKVSQAHLKFWDSYCQACIARLKYLLWDFAIRPEHMPAHEYVTRRSSKESIITETLFRLKHILIVHVSTQMNSIKCALLFISSTQLYQKGIYWSTEQHECNALKCRICFRSHLFLKQYSNKLHASCLTQYPRPRMSAWNVISPS